MSLDSLSPEVLAYSKARNPAPPLHLGTRYRKVGGFLPEPGNTIVCHVTKDSQTQDVLIEAREKFLAMPEAPQFVFTPITSLHMTLFQGIIEYRRRADFWPHDLPLDTPIDEVTDIMGERLEAFSMLDPFQVEVTHARPSGLLVEGATEQDRMVMREWRDAFADLLGYRHPDHDDYHFHITFGYATDWLEDEALPRWQAMLDEVAADIRREMPIIELDPPAFCAFEDMNHFTELLIFDFEA
ncbi:DUF1868 domain-containing protein [Pseudaminobacter soli (ex Li et al. 2025)]|uniref:DUF1868 domain-containing protein n=1 Tax=Pseudaminobacter soli (ex Li et al. 2025) TaxID=1295366 RepID=A0A2P7SNY0_9HYPH|nr:DUF1868 domain-containing protein [Mesorhizobium soli]PSJ64199.1 DUF1868 domain-containing protein [Mesorhizobium soli]